MLGISNCGLRIWKSGRRHANGGRVTVRVPPRAHITSTPDPQELAGLEASREITMHYFRLP